MGAPDSLKTPREAFIWNKVFLFYDGYLNNMGSSLQETPHLSPRSVNLLSAKAEDSTLLSVPRHGCRSP